MVDQHDPLAVTTGLTDTVYCHRKHISFTGMVNNNIWLSNGQKIQIETIPIKTQKQTHQIAINQNREDMLSFSFGYLCWAI